MTRYGKQKDSLVMMLSVHDPPHATWREKKTIAVRMKAGTDDVYCTCSDAPYCDHLELPVVQRTLALRRLRNL